MLEAENGVVTWGRKRGRAFSVLFFHCHCECTCLLPASKIKMVMSLLFRANYCHHFLSSTAMAMSSSFFPIIPTRFRATPVSSFPSKSPFSVSFSFKASSSQPPTGILFHLLFMLVMSTSWSLFPFHSSVPFLLNNTLCFSFLKFPYISS